MTTLSSKDILSNARDLKSEIASRADECAKLRRLPRDLVGKLRQAGVFRISMPKSWGGVEMPLPQQVELMEILAEADAAVSWCVKIGSDSGILAALLPERAARALYPSLDLVTAGQAPPNGRAVRAPGGYRVTGRWGFGSGCTHADVMVAGCIVYDGDKPMMADSAGGGPGNILVLAPASSWRIEDTWHAHGLAGSGSNHYAAEDLFVPDDHVIRPTATSQWCDGPLYAMNFGSTVFAPMAGTPLGLMRRAIDEVCGIAGKRMVALPPPPILLKDVPRARFAIARAETLYGAARAFVYDSVGRLWSELEASRGPSLETRRNVGLARINAFRMAKEVTRLLFDTLGAGAVPQSSPLERLVRDAATMDQHLGFNDGIVEGLGATMFGEKLAVPFL